MAKAQVELKLASTVVDNKKAFVKYVNSKRRTKENIDLLLDEVGHLTNKDGDKAETINAFLASVFNTNDEPWVEGPHPGSQISSQLTLNLCGICCCS